VPLGAGWAARWALVVLRGGGRSRARPRAMRFARGSEQVSYLVRQRIERCRFDEAGISTSPLVRVLIARERFPS
jgi:hypothetical protein